MDPAMVSPGHPYQRASDTMLGGYHTDKFKMSGIVTFKLAYMLTCMTAYIENADLMARG
jgi:hypothetical protein